VIVGRALPAPPRLLPDRPFPAYAYLPGRQPHPVRDRDGHSYGIEPATIAPEAALGSEAFQWGVDLFNHGYYWEAHEAWEGLWQAARGSPRHRLLFKALILLAAAGVKLREGKRVPAARHATRAAATLRKLPAGPDGSFATSLGMPTSALARHAEAAALAPPVREPRQLGQAEPVFAFQLASSALAQ
jgi:predicted metal-dependent hydrolase